MATALLPAPSLALPPDDRSLSGHLSPAPDDLRAAIAAIQAFLVHGQTILAVCQARLPEGVAPQTAAADERRPIGGAGGLQALAQPPFAQHRGSGFLSPMGDGADVAGAVTTPTRAPDAMLRSPTLGISPSAAALALMHDQEAARSAPAGAELAALPRRSSNEETTPPPIVVATKQPLPTNGVRSSRKKVVPGGEEDDPPAAAAAAEQQPPRASLPLEHGAKTPPQLQSQRDDSGGHDGRARDAAARETATERSDGGGATTAARGAPTAHDVDDEAPQRPEGAAAAATTERAVTATGGSSLEPPLAASAAADPGGGTPPIEPMRRSSPVTPAAAGEVNMSAKATSEYAREWRAMQMKTRAAFKEVDVNGDGDRAYGSCS